MIARQQELNFLPGEQHLYSNAGYFLLSQIVLRVTGVSLREFALERIFTPLGMAHTHFHDDHTEIVPGRAAGYSRTTDGFRINMTTLGMIGDGGVFTTVEDLLHHYPRRHEDRSRLTPIDSVAEGDLVTVGGAVGGVSFRRLHENTFFK